MCKNITQFIRICLEQGSIYASIIYLPFGIVSEGLIQYRIWFILIMLVIQWVVLMYYFPLIPRVALLQGTLIMNTGSSLILLPVLGIFTLMYYLISHEYYAQLFTEKPILIRVIVSIVIVGSMILIRIPVKSYVEQFFLQEYLRLHRYNTYGYLPGMIRILIISNVIATGIVVSNSIIAICNKNQIKTYLI